MSLRRVIFVILLLLAPIVFAETERDVTDKCKIESSDGFSKVFLNNDYKTYWKSPQDGAYVLVTFPDDITAGGVRVDWFEDPKAYEVRCYAADKTLLSTVSGEDYFIGITGYFECAEHTKYVQILSKDNDRIVRVFAYSAGAVDTTVQKWEKPVEKADIMLISTHQDDEELWFGGTIPYYAVEREADMAIVYMASCGRTRKQEALNGLWAMGVTNYPEFVNLKDAAYNHMDEAVKGWGGENEIIGKMVGFIRKYRPEVIVTHDINGEYGHMQHRVTAKYIQKAIVSAADASQYKDMGEAWQVKKLYLHLGDTNTITMDWETPSDRLNGLTPMEAANIGFAEHKSQQSGWSMEMGRIYDNHVFSLVYSSVGEDVFKDDFLENTVADPRKAVVASTPEPTYTPQPAYTSVPTVTPEITNTPYPEPEIVNEVKAGYEVYAVLGLAFAAILVYVFMPRKKRRRKRR